MTRLRRTIAARLKEAQHNAAMLTTFNEVDMTAAMALRAEYRDAFEKKHGGVRLGFMSFFVKATVAALKEFRSSATATSSASPAWKRPSPTSAAAPVTAR